MHLELDWGLAHEPLSSRSEAHCWLPRGRGLLRTGQGQGDVFTDSLCPHYPLPHPVWITWSKTPDFVIPPMVTCSCEQAVLGPQARCLDRPASPGLHTSHMSREGWTSFCTSSLGAEGESFLPSLGDSPACPPHISLCLPVCQGQARQPREPLSHPRGRH